MRRQGVSTCFDRSTIPQASPLKAKLAVSLDDFYPSLEKGDIRPNTVLIFRYQGPKGAPGMPEVRYPIFLPYIFPTFFYRC